MERYQEVGAPLTNSVPLEDSPVERYLPMKSRFWTAFTATTRAKAEQAAAAWWAEQNGLVKITGWTLPAADAGPHWTTTIIYQLADPPLEATILQ